MKNLVLWSPLPKHVCRSKKCCNRAGRQLSCPPHALSLSLSLHKALDTSKKSTFPLRASFKGVWFKVCSFSLNYVSLYSHIQQRFVPLLGFIQAKPDYICTITGDQPFNHPPEELILQLHHRRGVTGSLKSSPKSKISSTKLPHDKPLRLTPKSWDYV